ncbi:MAG: hypothetical protein Q9168_003475 [Polycauliona sp. 1 TL-2023]
MPATDRRSEILAELVANCTYPKTADLETRTCHICQEESLGQLGGEIPVTLRCGHTLGMTCLTTWTFQQIESAANRSPGCPFCRSSLLANRRDIPSTAAQRAGFDPQWDIDFWVNEVAHWTPGECSEFDNDNAWIQRAEELWLKLCGEILDDLDDWDPEDGLAAQAEGFVCGKAIVAERFLGFGAVIDFYQAYAHGRYRPLTNHIVEEFPVAWGNLMDHFDTAATVELDEAAWRVRQTFQGGHDYSEWFRFRMGRSKEMLLRRARQSGGGA